MMMARKGKWYAGVISIAALLAVTGQCKAGAVRDSLTFYIPSQKGKTDYFKTLKTGKAARLAVDVKEDTGCQILSGVIDKAPQGILTSGGPKKFTIVVPSTVPAQTYTFHMHGTYRCGKPKPGAPAPPPTWEVFAKLSVAKCDFEDSDIIWPFAGSMRHGWLS
jgi:hypothetical protein